MLDTTNTTAHREVSDMAMIRVSDLADLTDLIKALVKEVKSLRNVVKPSQPYDNKAVKELLGIHDKLLKRYRDDGLLGYSQVGDKYWYTRDDIDNFLSYCKVEPILPAA